ncbi:MAG: archaetidylserine decarboxylase [Pseudomonadota bacterium]|nr:archaetidylserine decarboxylase [Pseudomonadota bacterium]
MTAPIPPPPRQDKDPLAAAIADQLRNLPQYLYPQRLLSGWVYRLTRSERRWLKDRLIRAFIRHFRVDMSEALEADPGAYADFNRFFTRPLRPGARPLAAGESVLCCPVDGFVSQAGAVAGDEVFQAKGRRFSLTRLLGGDADRARPLCDGRFATLYLSPRDYHRIHMPVAGRLREMVHVPGKLFSVSPLTTRVVPGLFARNERLATLWDTAAGPMALVLVGAINVSSMETVWTGTVSPPAGKAIRRWQYPDAGPGAVVLDKGDEMGRFNMGSTVIVVFGPQRVVWDPAIRPEARVRMGQRLGEIIGPQPAARTAE